MKRLIGLLVLLVCTACAPQLPAGYHADATGERTANSEDQVRSGLRELASKASAETAVDTALPAELTRVPVPGNAIARRYERKHRNIDFCKALGNDPFETPSLDRLKDLRKDAELLFNALHGIDPDKRYADASVRVRRGETPKRRLPAEIKAALPKLEQVAHAYYARIYFAEQLERQHKLTPQARHQLVQDALTGITGTEATEAYRTVNTFFIVHCTGGSA